MRDNNELTQTSDGTTTKYLSTDHFGNLFYIINQVPTLVAAMTFDNESHLIEITDTAHDDDG